jgi:hypothetical protein
MSTLVAQFKEQTLNIFVQSMFYLISAEQDAPEPIYIKSNKRKKASEDKGLKPNKKQRTTK